MWGTRWLILHDHGSCGNKAMGRCVFLKETMKKNERTIVTWLLLGSACSLAGSNNSFISRIAMPEKGIFTVQVASFPFSSAGLAFQLYEKLKNEGEFVYYQRVYLANRGSWVRVRMGLFQEYTQAARFKEEHLLEKSREALIVRDTLLVREYGEDLAIRTPNAVWAKLDGKYIECLNFGHILFDGVRNNDYWDDYTQPFLSPSRKEILFEYGPKIFIMNLLNGERDTLDFRANRPKGFSGIGNSLPQKSPSGEYLAFIDANVWESYSNLWLHTGYSTFKVIEANNANCVKSFRWHPQKDIIFYVFGYATGTVSVGGDIYATDTKGNRVRLIESANSKDEEITVDISVDDDYLFYRIARYEKGQSRIIEIRDVKAKLDSLMSIFDRQVGGK